MLPVGSWGRTRTLPLRSTELRGSFHRPASSQPFRKSDSSVTVNVYHDTVRRAGANARRRHMGEVRALHAAGP